MTGLATVDARTTRRSGPTQLPRLLAQADSEPMALAAHRRYYGPLPLPGGGSGSGSGGSGGPGRIIELVTAAGLRGRGGAGFPTGRKLATVSAGRRRPVVVVNGCESEPASAKDATLLGYAPHLVLDGAALAGYAVGAERVVICVHRGSGQARRLEYEIAARTGDPVRWEIAEAPRRYVASEESALVHFLNAGEARPTATPPRPFERGVANRPTLIDNAETLAHLAQIVHYGPDWFRALGTPTDPGSTLVTLGGVAARPGVYEIALGTPLETVFGQAGGLAEPVQAYLVGGYFGTWVPAGYAPHLALSHDASGPAGTTLGAGALVALPATACGLAETARIAQYLAQESAGQCGPCMFGLPAIAGDLMAVAQGRPDRTVYQRITGRLGVIAGRGACKHPDGAIRLVDSALRAFSTDLDAHLRGRPCPGIRRRPLLPLPGVHERDGGWR